MSKVSVTRLWAWFRLLMGAIGLIVLLTIVDLNEVSEAIQEANWWYLIPAWVLMMIATAAKTLRWYLPLRHDNVNLTYQRLFGTYLIGAFYGQFLPGSSAGGDAMRIAESSVDTGKGIKSAASVIIERGIGLTTIVTSASLILLFSPHEGIPTTFIVVVHTLSILGISGLTILRFGWFVPTIAAIMKRVKLGRFAEKFVGISEALQGDLGKPTMLLQMIGLSLVANFSSMSAFYLALVAVTDPVNYLDFISLVAIVVTTEAIPLTPGALGVREGAYVFFLAYLGVSEHDALTIALLIRLLNWTQALLGGMVLLERGINQPKQALPDSGV